MAHTEELRGQGSFEIRRSYATATRPDSDIDHISSSSSVPDVSEATGKEPREREESIHSDGSGHGYRHSPIYDRLDYWFGGRMDLEPALRRRHIMMISIGATIGMGLVISSSKILRLSGSTGLILSYAMMGTVVVAVMSCISEMVSLIPEPGALALFPTRFFDSSLGLAVGLSYWFTNAMAVATLTTATTTISTYWERDALDLDIGWRITVFLLFLIIINVLGVKAYAEVEHFFGWLKILMILGLTIFSLAISCGANAKHEYYGIKFWRDGFKIPPNFAGHEDLTGTTGGFLSIWQSCTTAAFAYVGVEIVAMTSGESKYPIRDIPFTARYVWLITISLYVSSVIFVSLFDGTVSPFWIALDEAGYSVLPGLVNAGFLFAAWTAANTCLYVASRVLYGMCQGMTPRDNPFLWPLGRTRKRNGAPVMAILASCVLAPLAYLLCTKQDASKLLDIFSTMGTIACLMTWGSQCLAFLRFYFGLRHTIYDRSSPSYPYQSVGQPFTAIFGLVSCSLLVIFNGWSVFYEKPFNAARFCAAYLWPVIFFSIYVIHKLWTKSQIEPLDRLNYYSFMGARDEPLPPSKGRLRNLIEFERPTPRSRPEGSLDPVV